MSNTAESKTSQAEPLRDLLNRQIPTAARPGITEREAIQWLQEQRKSIPGVHRLEFVATDRQDGPEITAYIDNWAEAIHRAHSIEAVREWAARFDPVKAKWERLERIKEEAARLEAQLQEAAR